MSQDALQRRRDRAIAIVLGIKEREVDSYLPPQVSAKLRKVILDQFNDFYEVARDLAPDSVTNDLYLQKLEEVHEDVRRLLEPA